MLKPSHNPSTNTKVARFRLRNIRPLPIGSRNLERRQVNAVRKITTRKVPGQKRVRTGLVDASNLRVRKCRDNLVTRALRRVPIHGNQFTNQDRTRTRVKRFNTPSQHLGNYFILFGAALRRHVVNFLCLVLNRLPARLNMHGIKLTRRRRTKDTCVGTEGGTLAPNHAVKDSVRTTIAR